MNGIIVTGVFLLALKFDMWSIARGVGGGGQYGNIVQEVEL